MSSDAPMYLDILVPSDLDSAYDAQDDFEEEFPFLEDEECSFVSCFHPMAFLGAQYNGISRIAFEEGMDPVDTLI